MSSTTKTDAGTAGSTLIDVVNRFKSAEIGRDLYIGVEAWPLGAWSVVVPPEGREIFEKWIADLRAALSAASGDGK